MKYNYKNIFLILGTCILSGIPMSKPVSAAKVFVSASTEQMVSVGEVYEIPIEIDAENESVNAVQGTLDFAAEALQIEDIKTAQSIIPFWIEEPQSRQVGKISFSGIIPGGFDQEKGTLFILRVKILKDEDIPLNWDDVKVLKNDGAGTETKITAKNWSFTVTTTKIGTPVNIGEIIDITPPEAFVPLVAHDPNIFDDRWFVVFSASDKISGIDHYEIQETEVGKNEQIFKKVSSPYELQDQSLSSLIIIRAIDKQGNIREERIEPKNLEINVEKPDYNKVIILGILAVLVLSGCLWLFKRKKDFIRRS